MHSRLADRRALLAPLAALPLLVSSLAHAEPPPKTIAVADLGLHILGGGVQRVLERHVAIQVSAGLYVPWTQTKNVLGLGGAAKVEDTEGDALHAGDPKGFIVRVRPFFYLSGTAPTGLWLSPFAQGGVLTADRAGTSRSGPTTALGASVGWAWLVATRVHVAAGAGAQVHAAAVPGGRGSPSYRRAYPQVDLGVGFAF